MKYNKGILITGASGFIGSALVEKLENENILYETLPHNLLYRDAPLTAFLKKKKYDYIFHLASYGNLFSQQDEDETIEANIAGVYNLLQATKGINYKGFINFSSSSVLLPHTTFYSAAKFSGEQMARAFASKYGKPIISVRPASVYGPGDNSAHFIPQVIHNLKTGSEMTVSLDPTHDWIYIDDLLSGVFTCIANIEKINGLGINISTQTKTKNEKVIHILEKISGKSLDYKEADSVRPYDNDNWVVDNAIIKAMGWKPQFTLEQGLRETYEETTKS